MKLRSRLSWWVRPTGRGWVVLVIVPALYAAGIIWGLSDLLVAALCVALLLVAGLVIALVASRRAGVERSLASESMEAGATARIPYTAHAPGNGLWPLREVAEKVTAHDRTTEFVLRGLEPNVATRVEFESMPRGVYHFGPTMLTRTDPLGLWARVDRIRSNDLLVVWPRTAAVPARLVKASIDTRRRSVRRAIEKSRTGDEFRSLRGYVPGDDIRRVHWAASAKRDALLVRENTDEEPEIPGAVVALDCRLGAYATPEDFETSVAAAASITRALVGDRSQVDVALVGAPSTVTHVESQRSLGEALNVLADTQAVIDIEAGSVAHSLAAHLRGAGAATVLCTGSEGFASAGSLLPATPVAAAVVAGGGGIASSAAHSRSLAGLVVPVAAPDALPDAWAAALTSIPRRSA